MVICHPSIVESAWRRGTGADRSVLRDCADWNPAAGDTGWVRPYWNGPLSMHSCGFGRKLRAVSLFLQDLWSC